MTGKLFNDKVTSEKLHWTIKAIFVGNIFRRFFFQFSSIRRALKRMMKDARESVERGSSYHVSMSADIEVPVWQVELEIVFRISANTKKIEVEKQTMVHLLNDRKCYDTTSFQQIFFKSRFTESFNRLSDIVLCTVVFD